MTDALMPPAFLRLQARPLVPTIDLTIHFRAPLPEEPHPWVLGIFTSAVGAGGVCTEDGQLWSEDGRLLARVAPARDRPVTGHLGLGSNVGDRRANLQAAVDALRERGVIATASSSVYETAPVGEHPDQRAFFNACVAVTTELGPEALLDAAKDVERALGRITEGEGYVHHGPRPIDIDVLALGDRAHASPR